MTLTKSSSLLGLAICIISNPTFAQSEKQLGLKITDASGCYMTEGSFIEPTISLMTAAYGDPSYGKDHALKNIRVAISAGCKIDEPDRMGLSPLNAAILFNEPTLVALYLSHGADPLKRISSKKKWVNNLNSFEFLEILSKKTKTNRESAKIELSKYKPKKHQ